MEKTWRVHEKLCPPVYFLSESSPLLERVRTFQLLTVIPLHSGPNRPRFRGVTIEETVKTHHRRLSDWRPTLPITQTFWPVIYDLMTLSLVVHYRLPVKTCLRSFMVTVSFEYVEWWISLNNPTFIFVRVLPKIKSFRLVTPQKDPFNWVRNGKVLLKYL